MGCALYRSESPRKNDTWLNNLVETVQNVLGITRYALAAIVIDDRR